MYWHRRFPEPALHCSLSSESALHHLRFAKYNVARALLDNQDGTILCDLCYSTIISRYPTVKKNFEIFYLRFVIDGHRSINYRCKNCLCSIITTRPLSLCNVCTRIHLEFLTNLEPHDINFIPDPLILNVNDYENW